MKKKKYFSVRVFENLGIMYRKTSPMNKDENFKALTLKHIGMMILILLNTWTRNPLCFSLRISLSAFVIAQQTP